MRILFEAREDEFLSSLAMKSRHSQGRRYPEDPAPTRTCFQRDRDRVIHSKAFRRLKRKTQVFIASESDHYRTRLTHTLEVAQIARHLSRSLFLNEDLAETIALAHDLGHTPFGHSGERALHDIMKNEGGFEHNRQSLHIVDSLEKKYPFFDGLNLSAEVRHGLLKHQKNINAFNEPYIITLESQVANLADEFAYHTHDIDDGITSNILSIDALKSVQLYKECYLNIKTKYSSLSDQELKTLIQSDLLTLFITNTIQTTQEIILNNTLQTHTDIYKFSSPIVTVDSELREKINELKGFLFKHLYKHPTVSEMNEKGMTIIRGLFTYFSTSPEKLPSRFQPSSTNQRSLNRNITDYIAGMTDTFAQEEYKTLVSSSLT